MEDSYSTDAATFRHQRIIDYLHEIGGASRTVELLPHVLLRRSGSLATPEAIVRVLEDITWLERDGVLTVGEQTAAGRMVMLFTANLTPVVLTCERLVTLYGWMNEHERAMLGQWEIQHLPAPGRSTVDWPGWPTVYRRRYPSSPAMLSAAQTADSRP